MTTQIFHFGGSFINDDGSDDIEQIYFDKLPSER